jgi:hypothetical protein
LINCEAINREQYWVYVGTEHGGKRGAGVDERRNSVERLFKPKVFEGSLHRNEGLDVRFTCNFNGDVELTVVRDAGTLKG